MTFTNTQTKLGQAITTNDSGDYAVRTIIEGDQTLENLTLTGDLNGGGGHILNEQTTTNMMSKGTVYRFADGQYITITETEFDINACAFNFKVKLDSLTQAKQIVLGNSATGGNFKNIYIGSGGTLEIESDTNTDIVVGTLNAFDLAEHDYFIVCESKTVSMYQDGIALTIASGNPLTDNISINTIGDVTSGKGVLGSVALVGAWNFAPTASEVKDLISGNIPFKWQYGSQTSLVTGDDSDFDTDTGNWTDYSGAVFNGVVADWDGGAGTGIGKFTLDAGGGANGVYLSSIGTVGKAVKVSIKAKLLTGDPVTIAVGNNAGTLGVDYFEITPTGTETVYTGTIISAGILYIGIVTVQTGSASQVILIDDALVYPIGVLALYDQTSITANNWFDLANGNTGAVTGASVLNPKGIAVDEDNIPIFSVTSGITANVGSAQGNGVLTSSINQIATCGTSGDAVTLPSAKPGKVLWITNDGANAADVFPASGDNIDEAGANTAKALPADGEMQFICTSAGHWTTITSA